jgi:hypothetical protein
LPHVSLVLDRVVLDAPFTEKRKCHDETTDSDMTVFMMTTAWTATTSITIAQSIAGNPAAADASRQLRNPGRSEPSVHRRGIALPDAAPSLWACTLNANLMS